MKKFSATLIAALIFVLLLGYLFLFGEGEPDEGETEERVFAEISEGEINEITLKYPSYTVVSRKEGEKWFVIKDSKRFEADERAVSAVISEIAGMKVGKTISENPADLGEFGLDNPQVEVTMRTPEKKYSLRIGKESPIGSGMYVQVGDDGRVFLADGTSLWGIRGKSANDLRDKRIVSLDKDEVKKLGFKSQDSYFEVEKKGGEWIGEDIPRYAGIDQEKMEGIVGTFSDLRISKFEDDDPEDLSKYGLDQPKAEIEIFEGGKSVRLLFGDEKEGNYYVKLPSEAPVYSVSGFVFDQVPKDIRDLRDRKFVKVNTEKVDGLEIRRGDTEISILKQGDDWKLKNSGTEIEGAKVRELLEEIEDLRIDEFVHDNPEDLAPYGLDNPRIRLTIKESDKNTTLIFGKKKNGKVYAKLVGERPVYSVASEILYKIPFPKSKDKL